MTIIPNEDEFFYFRQIGDVIVSKATGRIITKLDENTFVKIYQKSHQKNELKMLSLDFS